MSVATTNSCGQMLEQINSSPRFFPRPRSAPVAAAMALLALLGCADQGDGAGTSGVVEDTAAKSAVNTSSGNATGDARHAGTIDGWWQTDGYGFAMEVRGDLLRLWQVTSVSCIPSYTGRRLEPRSNQQQAAFELDVGIRLTIGPGSSPDRKRMRTEGSVTDWGLVRIAALPTTCDQATASDPLSVFDVFWSTYAENYPFSENKAVDWNAVRAQYRPQVRPDSTAQELFEILSAMIRPLHDMHTHIFSADASYDGWRPDTQPFSQALLDRVTEIVEKRDVGAALRTWAGGRVSFADLPGQLGYLRITAFDFGTEDADADAAEMERILDEVFTRERIARQKGLIIDVRVSTGGHNPLGLLVAARLTRRSYLAYATVARRPQPDTYTDAELSWVRPTRGPAFTGPVVLLTSPYTVSAHEVFTQALMGRGPAVIRMGDNTQGAISDHHFRALPNGWVFTLPNQRFFSGGVAYDGGGVPPTIRTPIMTPGELETGTDTAFDKAVAVLTGRIAATGP